MGWGTLRWAAFLRKLKPGGTFFQIWVVCQCNVGPARIKRSTNCRRAAMSRHQKVPGVEWKVTRGTSLAQSGSVCHPQQPRPAKVMAALSEICPTLSQRISTLTLTFPASQIPSQGHIVAPAGQDWEGRLGAVGSKREHLTK